MRDSTEKRVVPKPRTYWRNLILIVTLKVIFLTGLWWLCFSDPPANYIDNASVVNQMLAQ